MQNLWNPEDQSLLERLNTDTLSVPTLVRPEPSIRFYIKTYWSKDGMGMVLLQEDVSSEARNSEAKEKDDGKCELGKSLKGMRLRPIYFILISTVSSLENSRHSFVG